MSTSSKKTPSGRDRTPSQSDTNLNLLETITDIKTVLADMRGIIHQSNFIAVNASIEAARSETQSDNFSMVADQVRRQAHKSEELACKLGKEIRLLEVMALHVISLNYVELSTRSVAKYEHSLSELLCKARLLKNFKALAAALQKATVTKRDVANAACKQILHDFVNINDIAHCVLLLNNDGQVVASSQDILPDTMKHLITEKQIQNQSFTDHFSPVVKDKYFDKDIQTLCLPFHDEHMSTTGFLVVVIDAGKIGEMIARMPAPEKTDVYILTRNGDIIHQSRGIGILSDNLCWLKAFSGIKNNKSGYSIESARDGSTYIWGFCPPSKSEQRRELAVSAIASTPIELHDFKRVYQEVDLSELKNHSSEGASDYRLQQVAENIHEQVIAINSVNDQSNMLAVNASIQAGVAGREGDAFSVIARQISNLSAKTTELVQKVADATESLTAHLSELHHQGIYNEARDTLYNLNDWLANRRDDMQILSTNKWLNDDPEQIQTFLHRAYENLNSCEEICLVNLDGHVVATTQKNSDESSLIDRSLLEVTRAGRPYISDISSGESMSNPNIVFAVPLMNAAKQTVEAVLAARFSCKWLVNQLDASKAAGLYDLYLCDRRGNVVLANNREATELSFAKLEAFRNKNTTPFGYGRERVSGPARLGTLEYGFSAASGHEDPLQLGLSLWIGRWVETD